MGLGEHIGDGAKAVSNLRHHAHTHTPTPPARTALQPCTVVFNAQLALAHRAAQTQRVDNLGSALCIGVQQERVVHGPQVGKHVRDSH